MSGGFSLPSPRRRETEREREREKKERRAEKQQLGGKGGDGRGWWKAMLVGR